MRLWSPALALVALLAAGCSGADAELEPESNPDPTTTTSAATEILTRECRLAATEWGDIVDDAVMSGRFSTAGGLGIQQLELERFDGPRASLEVDCPSELLTATSEVEYQLALANAQLRACVVNESECDTAAINKSLDAADYLNGRVEEIVATDSQP